MLTTTTVWVTPSASPVTTTFVPPDSCASTTPYVTVIDTLQVLFPDSSQAASSVKTDCFPSGYQPTAYLSPEPFCPVGYTAACGDASGSSTSAICCPEGGWACANAAHFSLKTTIDFDRLPCWRLFTAHEVFSSAVFVAGAATFSGPATLQPGASINGFAYGVHILWESTDVAPGATPAIAGPHATGGSIPTGSVNGGIPGARQNTSEQDLDLMRLQIGLGVGIPLSCMLVAAIVFILWFRKRRGRGLVVTDEKLFGRGFASHSGKRSSRDTKNSSVNRSRGSGGQGLGFAIGKSRRSRDRSPTRNNGSGIIPPAPAYPTKMPKHTRIIADDPYGLGVHGRSNSEPFGSDPPNRPYTSSDAPHLSYNPLPMSPLLPPRPSTAISNLTGLSSPPPAPGSPPPGLDYDLPARPQSPGYAVHTELWRQQQHQWILDERRQISAQYERLRREQERENESVRNQIRRERENDLQSTANLYKHLEKDFGG